MTPGGNHDHDLAVSHEITFSRALLLYLFLDRAYSPSTFPFAVDCDISAAVPRGCV
jgi:hypothetical protein